MADEGVDILFAAGNCGQDCPDPRCQGDTSHSIRGANSYEHILCTAANDVNGNRIGYSSQGPGMIASEKPDISAPSHFLGSEVYGPGTPDSGTSTSCPVTAGAVAAIRTRLNSKQYSNQAVFDAFRNTAFNPMGDSWNADIGHGLAIPLGVASQFGLL